MNLMIQNEGRVPFLYIINDQVEIY